MATGAAGARVAVDARFVHRTNGSTKESERGKRRKGNVRGPKCGTEKETRLAWTRRPNDQEPTTTDDEAADRLDRGCLAGSGR
ncbi:hypothetical protein VTJ04DRAFT_10867 [Mycothermus thermophilus]|uniref:uncharacterized protein n=1 Tax=Humicola insolens TaxID=85995 RepID=UPI003741ECF6